MPEAANTGEKPDTQGQTVVAIDSRGAFYVNLLPVQPDNLIPQVQRVLEDKQEKVVYLKGDKDAKYLGDHGRHGRAPEGADREHRAHH